MLFDKCLQYQESIAWQLGRAWGICGGDAAAAVYMRLLSFHKANTASEDFSEELILLHCGCHLPLIVLFFIVQIGLKGNWFKERRPSYYGNFNFAQIAQCAAHAARAGSHVIGFTRCTQICHQWRERRYNTAWRVSSLTFKNATISICNLLLCSNFMAFLENDLWNCYCPNVAGSESRWRFWWCRAA